MKKFDDKGIGLVVLTLIIMASGIVIAMILEYHNANLSLIKTQKNIDKFKVIQKAITQFTWKNGRLPCPASFEDTTDSASLGVEKRQNDACQSGNGVFYDSTSDIFYGTVPVSTLGLSDDYMIDKWNNKIGYVISENFTTQNALNEALSNNNITGSIIVNSVSNVVYLLISYGQNAAGAYSLESPFQGGTNLATTDELDNIPEVSFERNFTLNSTGDDVGAFVTKAELPRSTKSEPEIEFCAETTREIMLDHNGSSRQDLPANPTITFPTVKFGERAYSNETCPVSVSDPPTASDYYYKVSMETPPLDFNKVALDCDRDKNWATNVIGTCTYVSPCDLDDLENKINSRDISLSPTPSDDVVYTGKIYGTFDDNGLPFELECLDQEFYFAAGEKEFQCLTTALSNDSIPEVVALHGAWRSLPHYFVNETAIATECATGYHPDDNENMPSINCSSSGWNTSTAQNPCEINTCQNSELAQIAEVNNLNANWQLTGQIEYQQPAVMLSCQTGYDQNSSGAAQITCGADGWDTSSAINPCIIKTCDENTDVYDITGDILMKNQLEAFVYHSSSPGSFSRVYYCNPGGIDISGGFSVNYGEDAYCASSVGAISTPVDWKHFVCDVENGESVWKYQRNACIYTSATHSRATFGDPGQDAVRDGIELVGSCKSGYTLGGVPGYATATCQSNETWDYTGYCYEDCETEDDFTSPLDYNGYYSPICQYSETTYSDLPTTQHGYLSDYKRVNANDSCKGCNTTWEYSTWRRMERLICCDGSWHSYHRWYGRISSAKCDTSWMSPVDYNPPTQINCTTSEW